MIDELVIDEEAGEIDVIVKQDQLLGHRQKDRMFVWPLDLSATRSIFLSMKRAPSIEEQLTRELERGKEERELLYTGITSGLHAAGIPLLKQQLAGMKM